MGFTRSQPARFIDERQVVEAIRLVAKERLLALNNDRMFIESPATILAEVQFLQASAAETSGSTRKQSDEVLASTLFEPDALELIKTKCKNRYWFWYLIAKLEPATFPLNGLAVARAHARAKDSLWDNRYGFAFVQPTPLEYQLKQMPPGFVLELWHKGRLLCYPPPDTGEYSVILNPILIED